MIHRLVLLVLLLTEIVHSSTHKLNISPGPTQGLASYYGKGFQGRKMANGHRFDRNRYTAASNVYLLGAYLEVFYPSRGGFVFVTITDRGPSIKGRVLDLSERAARTLGLRGVSKVEIKPVTLEDLWQTK